MYTTALRAKCVGMISSDFTTHLHQDHGDVVSSVSALGMTFLNGWGGQTATVAGVDDVGFGDEDEDVVVGVAGAKDDRRDAFVLADSLRTDQPSFRRLQLDGPQLLRLRELSRAEETLLEEFRRSANRLRDQLHRFYPQMLQLCSAADEPWLWALIDLAPTPAHAALLSEEQVQRVLKTHRIRRIKTNEVLGREATYIGLGQAVAQDDDVATMLGPKNPSSSVCWRP